MTEKNSMRINFFPSIVSLKVVKCYVCTQKMSGEIHVTKSKKLSRDCAWFSTENRIKPSPAIISNFELWQLLSLTCKTERDFSLIWTRLRNSNTKTLMLSRFVNQSNYSMTFHLRLPCCVRPSTCVGPSHRHPPFPLPLAQQPVKENKIKKSFLLPSVCAPRFLSANHPRTGTEWRGLVFKPFRYRFVQFLA